MMYRLRDLSITVFLCARALAARMTYLELNVDSSYLDEYTAALFLPHTELSLFPSALAACRKP